jgi:MFS family permease
VGILIIASNQLSCINGIFFYAKQMMDMVTDHNEELSKMLMLFLAFGQLLAAMMSGKLLNKYPRKTIFLIGQEVIIIILFLCFFFDMPNHFLSPGIRHFCMGILINLHVVIFNLTLGPICIFYCSEILSDLKYVILTLKILSMFFALTSDIMIHKLGIGTMFMIFGVISLVVCLYLR